MIQVSDLSKSFGNQLVLDNLNFDLELGQFITIIGRNGSGKSTLLKLLAKQTHFDRGNIFYNQKSITQLDSPLGVEFAYLTINSLLSQFEESLLDLKEVIESEVSVFDNETFDRLVKMFSLDIHQQMSAFSTGQRVKALLALKAAQRPKVYILDEVTAVLDPGSRFLLMNFLKSEVTAGALVLLCTNIASETEEVSDYLMVLGDRKLQLFTKKSELARKFEKVRMKTQVTPELRELIEKSSGQIIDFNTDLSVSVLFPIEAARPSSIEWSKDQRAVSISNISKYFSVG